MTRMRNSITCFGEALIDFLALPDDGGPRRFAEHPGGAPANVAVGIARLGGSANFAGMLSTDMFGDALLSKLQAYGVGTTQVRRTDAARTALAFVSLDESGERSFNFYRPPAADLLFRHHDFDPAAFADLAIFHACSNSLTEPAIAETTLQGMRMAAGAGALVSFDLNLRPSLWPIDADPTITLWEALALANLVKLSREELGFLANGESDAHVVDRLLKGASTAVVVTDGASPTRWWTREGSGSAPTCSVLTVDTTAAGDAFVAGLLYGIAAQGIGVGQLGDAFDDDQQRGSLLGLAAAVGALATTRYGAFAAMPTHAEALALMGVPG